MNVRQRMADVKQLRNNVCHGFFNLIIKPGWQAALYQVALYQVTSNGKFKDVYSDVYSKMREFDLNNLTNEYKIEDMDVSLMRTIASFWNGKSNHGDNYAPMEQRTLDALKSVKEDRNDDSHSSGNEDEEELYLQGLLSLVNLRQLIKAVDKNETRIPDQERLAFYQKYISEINVLKDKLDEERIRLVQTTKNVDRDIKKILESENPAITFVKIMELYIQRSMVDKENHEGDQLRDIFFVRASDAGIIDAHGMAALHFIQKKNPVEAVRRMQMIIDAYPERLPLYECCSIIRDINDILRDGNNFTDEMSQLVKGIKKQGYVVEWRDGKLVLPEVEKKEEEKRRRVLEEAEQWEFVVRKKK